MHIDQIRTLVRQRTPDPARVVAECRKALLIQLDTKAEQAEVLFYLAEALATRTAQYPDAALYASQAKNLAIEASEFFWAARAWYLQIFCSAKTMEVGAFWGALQQFALDTTQWGHGLSAAQRNEIHGYCRSLEKRGRHLVEHIQRSA